MMNQSRDFPLRALLAALLLAFFCTGVRAADAPIVDLDAAKLSPGPVAKWDNAGSAGGAFEPVDKRPAVVEIAGKRAVSFDGGAPLRSAFAVPDELVKGKPFTATAWAYVVTPKPREVLVSWASRPNGTAEFSYGPGNDGAFFGWDKLVRYDVIPAAAQWHHLAWTYDSTAGVRVFVDGMADAVSPGKLNIKAGGAVILGGGWDSAGKKATFPFNGALSRVQIWPRAMSLREIRNSAGWNGPFAPTPADKGIVPAESLTLKWEAGSDTAAGYEVRLAETESGLSDPAAVRKAGAAELKPASLSPGKAYVWRVDAIDGSGKVTEKGPVWTFTTDSGPAAGPMPRDRVAGVSKGLKTLRWTPGRYAKSQTLFFGTDADAVAKGSVEGRTLDANTAEIPTPAGLEYGKTYYWRVEQRNGAIPTAPGQVWAFRTEDEPVKDDVTFFVSSDTHYGLGNNGELNRRVIDMMNWLPGTPMPESAGGGIVRTPRGVVLDGDLLDKGFEPKTAPAAWSEFVQDYGLTGADGRLGYPVYEGFGNHDGMTGKSISRAGVKDRNPKRVGLTAISSNGFHYSWDWDHVHLVQLNLFPGKDSADCIVGPPNHHPEESLAFLKEDLAKNVGTSGKIVIVFCHYCYSGGMADWWTEPAKDRFRDVVKGYRTLLIHGHSHGAYFYEWKGLRAISDGSTARPDSQSGDFLVVRITKDQLQVAQRKPDGWGITLKEPLPSADRTKADQQAVGK